MEGGSRSLKSKSNKGEFLVSCCGCLAAKNTKVAKEGGEGSGYAQEGDVVGSCQNLSRQKLGQQFLLSL